MGKLSILDHLFFVVSGMIHGHLQHPHHRCPPSLIHLDNKHAPTNSESLSRQQRLYISPPTTNFQGRLA